VKYFHLAGGPRSGTSSQKWPKTYLSYDVTHKKNKTKHFFFIVDSKTCWVFWGFEQLSSAIGWEAMRLLSQPKYPGFSPISKYNIFADWQQMC